MFVEYKVFACDSTLTEKSMDFACKCKSFDIFAYSRVKLKDSINLLHAHASFIGAHALARVSRLSRLTGCANT